MNSQVVQAQSLVHFYLKRETCFINKQVNKNP